MKNKDIAKMQKERPEAYTSLADWFEKLNDDCGYEEWSQYLYHRLSALLPLGAKGIDIGCGSGYFTRTLKRAGYAMTGMDVSLPMLQKAEQLSQKERIPYLQADVTSFRLPEKMDFAVAINDCMNYVKKEKVLSAFKRVFASLKKGGYFLFDISSENKLRRKVGGQLSIDDREDVTYLSVNTLEHDAVTMDVTLFVKQKNGYFSRFDERHLLYIYTEEEILSALSQAGFAVIDVCGHMGEEKATSDRLEFLCQK